MLKKVILLCLIAGMALSASVDTDKYHDFKSITSIVKKLESQYKGQAELLSAGKSIEGRDLWILQITNEKTGPAKEKPAILICGGLHGDEPVTVMTALYAAEHLLQSFASDEKVRSLLDQNTFYVWPAVNPDGIDWSVNNPGNPMLRNLRPADDDRDGRMGEDPPEDLDKDGVITWMRVKDPEGGFRLFEDDRLVVPVNKSKGEAGSFAFYREGKDNDGDGKYNEDGPGGVDLNANFPSGWKMEPEQKGAGMYPGSEPETEAMLAWLTDHPNVALAIAYRAAGGKLFRPFDHLADKEVPDIDKKLYELLGEKYKEAVGGKLVHGFPESKGGSKKKPAQKRVSGDAAATKSKPDKPVNNGTFIDWVYKDFNGMALAPAVWTLPKEYTPPDSVKTKSAHVDAYIDFLEKEWDGKGFVPWKKYNHPQLGEVEIGGWPLFYKKNPPPGARLKDVCEKQTAFIVQAAELLPHIEIESVEINPIQIVQNATEAKATIMSNGTIKLSRGSSSIAGSAAIVEVKVQIKNTGVFPTRSALAEKTRYSHQQPRSVLAILESDDNNIEILTMPKILRLGVIDGEATRESALKESIKNRAKKEERGEILESMEDPQSSTGSWLVKINGRSSTLRIRIRSEKAGVATRDIRVTL